VTQPVSILWYSPPRSLCLPVCLSPSSLPSSPFFAPTFSFCLYFLSLSLFVRMAIEEPNHTVISTTETYEVRSYPPIIVAETKVNASFDNAGNQAFRILASFIFGKNKSKTTLANNSQVETTMQKQPEAEKIAMTAPVIQLKEADNSFVVRFTMPKKYISVESLPEPLDERVTLKTLDPKTYAVYRYSGVWSQRHFDSKLALFRSDLEKNHVKTKGEPVYSRYDPPWTLWFWRRNEIWLEVESS